MATSENNCTDNYTLPQGPAGVQGPQGNTGPTGVAGPQGLPGTQGPSGASKIDINIQQGERPYTEIDSTSETAIAYFIFPDPVAYTLSTFKVLTSIYIKDTSKLTIKVYEVKSNGSTVEKAKCEIAGPSTGTSHEFRIGTDLTFSSPSAEAMMKITASLSSYSPGTSEARVYAAELR